MEPIQEETPTRPTSAITINVGLFPAVPGTVDFGGPSYAVSSPECSQVEYENVRVADLEHERRVSVLGLSHGLHHVPGIYPDDRIAIECADNTNIACQPHYTGSAAMVRLFMARSHLMHSGWFVTWFDSPHYLARAGMKIAWPRDPLACWEMAKCYMEDGYDRFGSTAIMTYVCTRFLLEDRFIVLVRLYKLARILELFGLMDRAFEALLKMEHLITPLNVLTLVRYIFGGPKYCKNIIKLRRWCLKWIDKHYDWLLISEQWAKMVERSVPELGKQWMKIKTMKQTISQEDLKRAIQQNVSDATAIIDALKAVGIESKTSPQAESGSNEKSSRRKFTTLGQGCTFTKLERKGMAIPNEIQNDIDSSDQSTSSLGDSNADNDDLNSNAVKNPTTPTKPSFSRVLEAEYDEPVKVNDIVGGNQSAESPRLTLLQEAIDHDETPITATSVNENISQESLPASTNRYIRPISDALPSSISEPLLTLRRNISTRSGANRSTFDDLRDAVWPMLSGKGDSDENVEQHDRSHSPLRRGLVLVPEDLREPDSWPLSDIPLRDPLLPVPVARRVASFDRKARQFNDLSAITVFGLHRPGMGGSVVVPASEGALLGESRAGVANVAKAREFLGI